MPKIKVKARDFEINLNDATRKSEILTQALEKMIEVNIRLARSEDPEDMQKALEFHGAMRPYIKDVKRILEKYQLMEQMILDLD